MSETPDARPTTQSADYARRLYALQNARWKQVLDVQLPYRWNLRRLHLGTVLDVGCGIGRNLVCLDSASVGVDHNGDSVRIARAQGLTAYTTEEFFGPHQPPKQSFDSLLLAHVVEHMPIEQAREMLAQYLPYVRSNGQVLFICPQERGYASDPTHVSFTDDAALAALAESLGLTVERAYSFPLPRLAGKMFRYNEFCVLCRSPADTAPAT